LVDGDGWKCLIENVDQAIGFQQGAGRNDPLCRISNFSPRIAQGHQPDFPVGYGALRAYWSVSLVSATEILRFLEKQQISFMQTTSFSFRFNVRIDLLEITEV